jgi:hypothetical protein
MPDDGTIEPKHVAINVPLIIKLGVFEKFCTLYEFGIGMTNVNFQNVIYHCLNHTELTSAVLLHRIKDFSAINFHCYN